MSLDFPDPYGKTGNEILLQTPLPVTPPLPYDQLLHAVRLCKTIEPICIKNGFHIALTGGVLHKDGNRKYTDLILYKNRQNSDQNLLQLWNDLQLQGVRFIKSFGFVTKFTWQGNKIDMLYPEFPKSEQGDEY